MANTWLVKQLVKEKQKYDALSENIGATLRAIQNGSFRKRRKYTRKAGKAAKKEATAN